MSQTGSPVGSGAATGPPAGRDPDASPRSQEPSGARRIGGSLVGAIAPRAYLIVVLAIVVLVGTMSSEFFFTERNLLAVLVTASVIAVLAVGQFHVMVTGGIDLSVGSVVALSSVVSALILSRGSPLILAIVAALGVGALCGVVNGVLVVYGRVAAFIATLAMLSVARGLAYIIQQDRLIPISDRTFLSIFSGRVAGIPAPVLIALLVMVLSAIVMSLTPAGRRLYAFGGNPEAARLSGLPVNRDVLMAYVTSATLASIAGLMLAAQLRQGSAITGTGYELDSIAAAVVGGTALMGGTGDPVRAVLGALVIAAISNIMDIRGIAAEAQLIVQGGVIVLAVYVTSGSGTRAARALVRRIRRGSGASRRQRAATAAAEEG
ncbi:ABC transporter permease [Conexibacter sp. CPCC 206217]|uniref:ABC transporter permease n=1 Tax=Conexibacter sp. CPCC 206217 TaxID=3064574 RepID=UPI00271EFE79|nr:ABC transporter permease [Conexibacter sp. CPCC 206217]MDO8208927.1 ABC transporter permease [Conexibacter sp. CPCC 206217]